MEARSARRRDVQRLLARHRPGDESERRHHRAMLALLAAPGDPFSRDRFDPGHFTASGFVLSPDGGALLMVLHAKLGRWLQPGGHFEPADADARSAARREVLEEVGIEPPAAPGHDGLFDVDVHPIPRRGAAPAHRHYDLRFLFRASSAEFSGGSEVRDARWVALDDLGSAAPGAALGRVLAKLAGSRRL